MQMKTKELDNVIISKSQLKEKKKICMANISPEGKLSTRDDNAGLKGSSL